MLECSGNAEARCRIALYSRNAKAQWSENDMIYTYVSGKRLLEMKCPFDDIEI